MAGSFPTQPDIERIYSSLRLIRRVEEEVVRLYPTDKIKSPVHLSIGQESVAVGVIDALHPDDFAASSYRCHATYLAKGADLRAMIAELYGKSTGCARGKGGSMHLVGPDKNVLGASAVVGTHIPVAAGHAMALKREGRGRLVVVFFGDGATEEGCFYETLNFAALQKLPMLFVCENNGYAGHIPLRKRWPTDRLCERVRTYGMPAERIEDGDVFRLREKTTQLVESIRSGNGPAFLECLTYRWMEHVGPNEDFNAGYRSRDEAKPWMELDEVMRVRALLPGDRVEVIEADVEAQLSDAFAFADASPVPALEELLQDDYA